EPIFAFSYTRKVLQPDGGKKDELVEDYAVCAFHDRFGADAALPDYFVTAQTLAPEDHLAVQAAAQPFIDSAISKTINVPASISFDAFKDVYLAAYRDGCKGCTTYLPNDVTGSVLSVDEPKTNTPAEPVALLAGAEPELPLPLP